MDHQKTELPGLFRDHVTGALVNKDNMALEAYKKQKRRSQKISLLEKRVEMLEQKIEKQTINNSKQQKILEEILKRLESIEESFEKQDLLESKANKASN